MNPTPPDEHVRNLTEIIRSRRPASRTAVAATLLSALLFLVTSQAFALLDPPTLTAPANRDTNQPASPQLRWNAVVYASQYEVQVSTDSTFSQIRFDTFVAASPSPSIVVGPYGYDSLFFWRVRTGDSAAAYGIWSGAWRFKTIRPTPSVPVLASPPNNATNLFLTDTLTWTAVAFAEGYGIQVSTSSGFASLAIDTVIVPQVGNTRQVLPLRGLVNNLSYWWRVNGRNSAGNSAWSTAWKFTTIVDTPATPVQVLPANGAKSLVTNPTLSWGAVAGAATYRLQVATDSLFTATIFNDSTLTSVTKQVAGLITNTRYFWRVRAKNVGGTGSFSASWSFSTYMPQAVVVSPIPGGTVQPTALTLDWLPVAGAVNYRVQVSTATGFSPLLVGTTTAADQYPLAGLTNNTKYYWRVSAVGANGDTSTYPATTWNFTTIVDTATVPVLLTPANGAKSLPTNPTLTWSDSGGATYRLQVSADPTFATVIYDDSTLTQKTKQITTGLTTNATYYWRVNAKNAASTTSFSPVWSFTTQMPQPALVAPATGATGQPLSVSLDWAPVIGAVSYRLQVSTATSFAPLLVNTPLVADVYALSGLTNNTKFYWRVQAANANGDTCIFPATAWNFTTIVDTPTVPWLLAPVQNATSQPLSLTLSWEDTGGTGYRVQVATDAGFASLVVNDSIGSKTRAISGLATNTRYYWRVYARNAASNSAWSPVRSFTTFLAPAAPVSPPTNAVDQPIDLVASWQAVPGAATYLVQVSPVLTPFTPSVVNAVTAATEVPLSGLLSNVKYYWRVSARNANNDTSAFPATPWNFKTKIPAPLLSSPANNARNLAVNPTLSWNASSGGFRYRLQVSEDPAFPGLVKFDDSTLSKTTTSRQIGPLDNSTTYYWRLNARDSLGTSTSAWSDVWSFATKIDTPNAPVLLSPVDGAASQPITLPLSWSAVVGATLYKLQVAVDSLFTQMAVDGPPDLGLTQTVGPLNNNRRYYWRVGALNSAGTAISPFSAPRSFTTVIALPDAPILAAPASGAINQATVVALRWHHANSASTYRLEVATDSRFGVTVVVDTASIIDTSVTVGPLQSNTSFYWRVTSANALGISSPSSVWNFSTILGPPQLTAPSDNLLNVPPESVMFQWQPVSGATSYRLQISPDPAFSTLTVDDSLVAGTSRPGHNLSVSKKYYWRVSATSITNGVAWSVPWSFTTTVYQPDIPALVFPANGSGSQPVRMTLRWLRTLGAQAYRLQVATDSSFTTGVVFDSPGLTDTSQVLPTLQYTQRYYWRVMASNDIGPSGYSPTWYFVTSVPPPAVPALALPVNGETNVSRPVTLVWRRSAGAAWYNLRVMLPNHTVYESRLNLTDTTALMASLAPGVQYLWRVVAMNTGGSDSSAEWGFTTVIDPPIAPQLVGPVDGSINLPVSMILRWRAVPGVAQYRLQVAADPTFTTLVYHDSTLTDTARVVGPLAGLTPYYWRLQARNAGGSSPFSQSWGYTTIIGTPVPVGPADGATHQPIAPVMAWRPVPGAATYRLQIAEDPLFAQLAYDQSTSIDTVQQIPALHGFTIYFWRVYAQNAGGSSTSPYTTTRNFTTMLDTPRIVSPADGTTKLATSPRFTWRVVGFAQQYKVQVATDPAFASIVYLQSGISDTTLLAGPLPGLTRCYWRVKALNQADSSGFSSAFTFTTTLQTPPQVSPVDGAVNQPIAAVLKWQLVTGGARNRVQVARDSLFASVVFDDSLLVGDSVRVLPLQNATRYYWRIRSKTVDGLSVSAFSQPWVFTTIVDTPAVPVLLSPANNGINIAASPTLLWRASALAERYTLQVAADPAFTVLVAEDSSLADTTKRIGPLAGLTKYYWRVWARNVGGVAPATAVWNFTTTISTPVLASPASGTVDLPIVQSLQWHPVPSATSYRVQVAADSLFAVTVLDDSTVTDSARTVGGLLNLQRYFWRVRAKNAAASSIGAFAAQWNFTTIIDTPTAPVAVYPLAGTTNVPPTLRFRWRKSDRATAYRFELSADSLFESGMVVDTTLADTSRVVTGISPFTRYFWRLRASNNGGVTPLALPWNFTTIPATPVLVTPANGTVNSPIALQFRWNPVAGGAMYRLQLSTDSTFKTVALDDSTLVQPQRQSPLMLNQTLYFWRVRARSADGTGVSLWADPWPFTTIIDTPSVPVLVSPADRGINVSATPTLRWRSTVRATRYVVEVASDSLFAAMVIRDTAVTDTMRATGALATLTRFWWRVRGANIGGTSPASAAWSFTTIIATPELASPADSATMQPTTLVLSWGATTGAVSYRLQVATDTLFTALVFDDSTITSPTRGITGLAVYTKYYWRVRAKNPRGVGEYSVPRVFTTIIIPPAISTLAAPANGLSERPIILTLRWKPTPLAERYTLQMSLDSPFSTMAWEDSTLADTVAQVGPLAYLTRFYWRIQARNSQGSGPFSPVWSFETVIESPSMPVLISPSSATADQPFFTKLVWSRSVRATRYHVQLARDAAFDSLVVNDTTSTDTLRQVGPLDHSRRYYWRVRAMNAGWTTSFTPVWSFLTLDPPRSYALSQNYPNPFNPVTHIAVQIPEETEVELAVFNLLGQRVLTVMEGVQKPGRYEVEIDAHRLPSGVYFYRLKSSTYTLTKKLMVVK